MTILDRVAEPAPPRPKRQAVATDGRETPHPDADRLVAEQAARIAALGLASVRRDRTPCRECGSYTRVRSGLCPRHYRAAARAQRDAQALAGAVRRLLRQKERP